MFKHTNAELCILDRIQTFLMFCPFVGPVLLYTFVIRARLVLGYFPTTYHPDPKTYILQQALGNHYLAVWVLTAISFLSIPLFIIFSLYKFLGQPKQVDKKWVIFSLLWILFFLWWSNDPGRFIEWYFD